jgi:2-amino-4-hydroxy-6-hydroxymethyldihydropteridine diphosphokinase
MCYYLSLGSNLGNREQNIREALIRIEQRIGQISLCSSFFYSEPWGFKSEFPFCNVCCSLSSDFKPIQVLKITQYIERELGRTTKSNPLCPHYQDRIIDIDIIRALDDKGNEIIMNDSCAILTLPHPLWKERDFVRIPMMEILNKMHIESITTF